MWADNMKPFCFHVGIVVILLGVALGLELEKRDCPADNCLRQVRATRPVAQSHMASSDCSSYLAGSTTTVTYTPGFGRVNPHAKASYQFTNSRDRTTVTASTTTKTVHVTSTNVVSTFTSEVIDISVTYIASVSTVIIPGKKRDAVKAIPTYASSCTANGQYASACSCYGVFPPHTVTETAHSIVGHLFFPSESQLIFYQAPVTITKTITTTISTQIFATKTVVETSTSTRTHIVAQTETIAASSFSLYAVGAPVDGYYIVTTEDTPTLLIVDLFSDNPFAIPQFFTLDKTTGNLYQDSFVAVASVDDFNGLSFQSGIPNDDPTRLVCSVAAGGFLNCAQKSEGLSVFYACLDLSGEEFPPALYFYPPNSEAVVPAGCYPVQFKQMLAT
jgi:hypothetical protein